MRTFLRAHAGQFLLYVLSGGTAAVVDFGGYSLFIYFGVWYLTASVLSYVAAFFTTFLLNKYVVFRKKGDMRKHLIRFAIVDVANMLLSTLFLFILVSGMGMEEHIAKIIAMGIVVLWNFFVYKLVVYV